MNSSPSLHPHDDIARQARLLWQERGCPVGCDDEIWIEAERQMSGAEGAKPVTAPENFATNPVSPAMAAKEAITTALQKQEARAPQVPHHTGPRAQPAVTGKPVWPQGHSN